MNGLTLTISSRLDKFKFKDVSVKFASLVLYLLDITCTLSLNRPDVDFDVRLMRAVQVMDIPMLKDFINALVMDSLTYGKN